VKRFERMSRVYSEVVHFPDRQVGWLPYAVWQGRDLLRKWQPDIIFASGPPFTTLVVARLLHNYSRKPLVVEFRDRWSDDPYYPPSKWRQMVERHLESWVVGGASALVTVSQPWEVAYREKFQKPTIAIYNGFDPDSGTDSPSCRASESELIRILYTGSIYPGRRDPSPLFEALGLLGSTAAAINVEFYGTDERHVLPLAGEYGVTKLVKVFPPVPHAEAGHLQQRADVLLLMQWNNPKEQGNIPGKFFEYLGTRRPILVLGLENGVPATIVRERSAGFFSNDPKEIAAQLQAWLNMKRSVGWIPSVPEGARAGFTRRGQFERLEHFLKGISSSRRSGDG